MDTKFSVALHILVMISQSDRTLSSKDLAISVGTNASYIRKIISLLKNDNLIETHQGKPGYFLVKPTNQLSLLDVYLAVQETSQIHLFNIHQNPNAACPVGRYIQGALSPAFQNIEADLANELSQQSLSNIIDNLKQQVSEEKNESSHS